MEITEYRLSSCKLTACALCMHYFLSLNDTDYLHPYNTLTLSLLHLCHAKDK